MVGTARVLGPRSQRQQPCAVAGDDGASSSPCPLEYVRVRQAPQVRSLGDRDRIHSPTPESRATAAGIPWRQVLS